MASPGWGFWGIALGFCGVLSLWLRMKWPELVVIVVAMGGIVYLERLALLMGIDGALLGFVVAALAGLGGYEVRCWRAKGGSK